MMIRRKRIRSWSVTSHLQPDVCKEQEAKRVGVPRPTSNIIMIRRKRMRRNASSHLQPDDDKADEDEEEDCLVPPPAF